MRALDFEPWLSVQIAFHYLCRLEEAKRWIEACIREELSKVTDGMDASLSNGVTLAKLAKFVWIDAKFRIYDEDLKIYNEHGLNFSHAGRNFHSLL